MLLKPSGLSLFESSDFARVRFYNAGFVGGLESSKKPSAFYSNVYFLFSLPLS